MVRRLGGFRAFLPLRVAELPLRASVRRVWGSRLRDPRLLVFGCSLDRFADNSAYLFLHMSDRCPDTTCVWISGSRQVVERLRSAGYLAELRWSVDGVRACGRAGWFVVSGYLSDINRWLYDGAVYLNLWHGIGVKPIERDAKSVLNAFLYRPRSVNSLVTRALQDETRSPDYVLSSTDEVSTNVFLSAFDVPLNRCLPYGYPRNDHLLVPSTEPAHPLLVADLELWQRLHRHPFLVGYFPTWREESEAQAASMAALTDMTEIIAAQGGLLLFKAHVNTLADGPAPEGSVRLPPDHDLNVYLPLCSVVITDYASVTADFILLNRPLVYFLPGGSEASPKLPAIGGTWRDMLPGPIYRTTEELHDGLRDLRNDLTPAPAIRELSGRVWNGYSGAAAERIAHFVQHGDPQRAKGRSRLSGHHGGHE